MCDKNRDYLGLTTAEVHAEINRVENVLDALHAELQRRQRTETNPARNREAMASMAHAEAVKSGLQQQARPPEPPPVIHQEPDNLNPSERVRARARRLGFNL